MDDKRMMDDTKLCFHGDRVKAYLDRGERVAPIHLDIGLSKECQIRCRFCFGFFQNVQHAHIRREPLLQIIKDASDIGVKSIAAIGDGEPLMNPHAFEFFEMARDYTTIDMAISTNGIGLNTIEKCETILSSCKWARICIAAGTKDGYIKIHQRDMFEKVIRNIERMLIVKSNHGYPCDFGMQSVYVPGLMDDDMIAEAKLAVALGVNYLVIKQCSRPDDGESGMEYFDINAYDSQKTKDTLDYCESLSTERTRIVAKRGAMSRKGQRAYNGCLSVPLISEFSGNGDWYPCGFLFGDKPEFMKYRFGNVHEKSLKEIWESDHYWDIVRTMRDEFDVHKDCRGACRLDCTNKFCYDYLNATTEERAKMFREPGPEVMGVNFV